MSTQVEFRALPFQNVADRTPQPPPEGFFFVDQANYALVPLFKNPQNIRYLYSDSATSCIIVIGIGHDTQGTLIAALAHLDSPDCIQAYFNDVLDKSCTGTVYIYAQGANPPGNVDSDANKQALLQCLNERAQGSYAWCPEIVHMALSEGDPRVKDRGDYGISIAPEVPVVSNQPFALTLPDRDPTGGEQTVFCIMRRKLTPPVQLHDALEPFDPLLLEELVAIAETYQKDPNDPATAFTYIIHLTSDQVRNTWSTTPQYEAPWFADELKEACNYVLMQPKC